MIRTACRFLRDGWLISLTTERRCTVSGRGRGLLLWQELPFGSATKGNRTAVADRPRGNIRDKIATRWREYRIGFCDVASPTNQRVLVAALIPARTICGHKVPTVQFQPHDDRVLLLWVAIATHSASLPCPQKGRPNHVVYGDGQPSIAARMERYAVGSCDCPACTHPHGHRHRDGRVLELRRTANWAFS